LRDSPFQRRSRRIKVNFGDGLNAVRLGWLPEALAQEVVPFHRLVNQLINLAALCLSHRRERLPNDVTAQNQPRSAIVGTTNLFARRVRKESSAAIAATHLAAKSS
jgi:hypothetical protein